MDGCGCWLFQKRDIYMKNFSWLIWKSHWHDIVAPVRMPSARWISCPYVTAFEKHETMLQFAEVRWCAEQCVLNVEWCSTEHCARSWSNAVTRRGKWLSMLGRVFLEFFLNASFLPCLILYGKWKRSRSGVLVCEETVYDDCNPGEGAWKSLFVDRAMLNPVIPPLVGCYIAI